MPKSKDLKRLVRDRMKKTGESYTAARSRVLTQRLHADLASKAGMGDDAVKEKTGRSWREWTVFLDEIGALSMPHREIAARVRAVEGVSGWWAQMVTVGYERIRGLREIGQRRGGAFDANKSKTFNVPVDRLYRAFSVKRERTRWLGDVDLTIRTATRNKSMRMTWPDGAKVNAWFVDKGLLKSQVAIQHGDLTSSRAVDAAKAAWGERLDALADLLGR